jgi:serine protease Do
MRRIFFLLLLLGIIAFAAYRWDTLRRTGRRIPESFTPVSAPLIQGKDVPMLSALDAEYTKLIQTVVPSVVSVATARRVRVPVVDTFDYLFGWRGRSVERTQPSGIGSGVIVSKEGHILTNHHVIKDSAQIQVQLTDGRVLPATLIGADPNVDIAVLHIDPKGTVALPLGDSDAVKVGQNVFAVGNPFGLQETVTRGIISAKGRSLRDSGVEFFQTDAAVNPGNSGGPLLNVRGEIVGINSAIYSQTGSWAGISFAIPSNVAKKTLAALLKTGRPSRGYLGAQSMPLSPSLARQFGIRDMRGALVTDVLAGSPAERAGLQPGDVIRSVNGRPVADATAYRDLIASLPVGTKVELGIIRDGQQGSITAEIAEMPESAAVSGA